MCVHFLVRPVPLVCPVNSVVLLWFLCGVNVCFFALFAVSSSRCDNNGSGESLHSLSCC